MHRLVLISDWEYDSLYKTLFEGAVYSHSSINNISYIRVKPFALFETAMILRFCILNYPENSVVFVGVSSVVNEQKGYLYFSVSNKHIFMPNNGIIGLCNDIVKTTTLYKLPYQSTTFPELDIFLPAWQYISSEQNIANYATPVYQYEKLTNLLPDIQSNKIIATVIYVDVYGNIITNLSHQDFFNKVQNRSFVIYPGTKMLAIRKIVSSYDMVDVSKPFALFNALGLLELGIKDASLSEFYDLKFLSNITIEIYDT